MKFQDAKDTFRILSDQPSINPQFLTFTIVSRTRRTQLHKLYALENRIPEKDLAQFSSRIFSSKIFFSEQSYFSKHAYSRGASIGILESEPERIQPVLPQ